ncbi:rifampicin phosphotransferase-like [Maniola hyperantus]|uniref:rifampicin phosphotransferase-like n=1 Tax=Aphantopus hyperantus TaxID=2795564 RepID=UPI0015693C17|nr:putative phosphoenolpyruvate synthase [Maniola hyperantus]
MDLFDVLIQAGLLTAAVLFYLIFIRKPTKRKGHYREPAWNYQLKLILAQFAVKWWKSKLPSRQISEAPHRDQKLGWDDITLRASAPGGSSVLLTIRKLCRQKNIAEVVVYLQLQDGTKYKLPQHPETAISEWVQMEDGWSAGGLKIQILESQTSLRVIYNGPLTRIGDNVTQHVKLNLIWTSVTSVLRYPEDWSTQLAAETLALEPWREGRWPHLLDKCDEGAGSWMQWGAIQGRFQSFDADGAIDRSEYLRLRGAKERSWSLGSKDLRRSVTVTAIASDGTAVQIRGLSYYNNFTQCISGNVRFPNFMVKNITSTDLALSDFCERGTEIPNTYTINVSTANSRSFKVILRINKEGGRTLSGVPHKQELLYRSFAVEINGEHGTGILELGYDTLETKSATPTYITPLPALKWLEGKEAGDVGYCLPFDAIAATCTEYVGGKGASLALLASVQDKEGYSVPPGFCVTSKALNQQLEKNLELVYAISKIERANENYNESIFKEKCEKVVNLFVTTEIVEDVKDKILEHLNELRKKATDKKYGSQLRFAVRSSAVGEDCEALSAAGQNDTILGCVSDDDVTRAVQKCWASMFAFTSAYYRRQNGQPCMCGGGVVVQALVMPRVAGVMFTRHPLHGDPTRILITGNYGLGESVVSGSVEPDTIIVKRGSEDTLSIAKIELGSKTHRVTTSSCGVSSESVPEFERTKACLSESEILKLARIAVSQEKLWGAGRDIEWAIKDDCIFLLQARPITSLERWTEEELLHELDSPIMSDDELVTFANTGEVFPKPVTPLTHDMVYRPLDKGIATLMVATAGGYDKKIMITHNRCALALYNTVYQRVPKEIDINIRMLEMSIHGHKVADDDILHTALHRRQPQCTDKLFAISDMVKSVIITKWVMNDTIKRVNKMDLNPDTGSSLELFDRIATAEKDMTRYTRNHGLTTSASTFTQFIAMNVLLENRSEFSPELCYEIGMLLSSGDVLSAEVPHALARLVSKLEDSGKLEEFRSQDPNTAMDWLRKNLPNVYKDVCTFLEQHGHRAIMEFDLATKPWVLVPEELMKVLMHIKPSKEEHQAKTSDEIIASLKTPKKSSTRKVLRWILPLCHRAVRHREATKAHLILAVHKLRVAALSLGRLLTRSWHLPHPDLVFYFRVSELRDYITTRDPAMLKKAIQRQQYYPGWCKQKFAEIIKGWPQPLAIEKPRVTAGGVRLQATSVCGGEVIARACVVKDLSEISLLQQGDVLITNSTDIGWSPYFPLLSGIVTELGGLISHGAVIAREYGLPCVVGATHATTVFTTGDMVRLSGREGVVETVQVTPQDQTDAN